MYMLQICKKGKKGKRYDRHENAVCALCARRKRAVNTLQQLLACAP